MKAIVELKYMLVINCLKYTYYANSKTKQFHIKFY